MTTANQLLSRSSSESSQAAGFHRQAQARDALNRALTGDSHANYEEIIDGFAAMGIAPQDIKPRENIFTFLAWKAVGRYVRKGEHGVRVFTYVEACRTDKATGEKKAFRMPRHTTVFHRSQTEALVASTDGVPS